MPTIQILKKKLHGINATKKITKAMKTASTIKYSRLVDVYNQYRSYDACCRMLCDSMGNEFAAYFSSFESNAPVCYVVMASNKSMCGNFNYDICTFAEQIIRENADSRVYICGCQAQKYFDEKELSYYKAFSFDDVPSYGQAEALFSEIRLALEKKEISSVKLIFPEYVNTFTQKPVCVCVPDINPDSASDGTQVLYVPDMQTVAEKTVYKIFDSMLYKRILETALGAQAATLVSMRSAYDSASEYSVQLESDINRKRQSRITADVIYSRKKEE